MSVSSPLSLQELTTLHHKVQAEMGKKQRQLTQLDQDRISRLAGKKEDSSSDEEKSIKSEKEIKPDLRSFDKLQRDIIKIEARLRAVEDSGKYSSNLIKSP